MAKTLSDLATEYEAAKEDYENAERATSAARMHETECLNRLNKAQGAWDEHIAAMRKEAPRDSDWKQDRGSPVKLAHES